jgi:hypothetical protein
MLKKIILIFLILQSYVYCNSGALYIKLSDGFYAGTEYKTGIKDIYIKSNIETKIKTFDNGMMGFIPDKIIYRLELGIKLNE